jgi:uncharacterized membrane protein (DUF485 family)
LLVEFVLQKLARLGKFSDFASQRLDFIAISSVLVVVVVIAVVIVPSRTLHGCAGAPRCFPSAIVPVARAAAVGILICLISTRASSTLCGVSL